MPGTRSLNLALAALAICWIGQTAASARAQTLQGPEETRPELPGYVTPSDEPPLALPELAPPSAPERARLSTGLRVFVSQWRVRGSTVFSDADFARVLAPYTGREIGSEDLIAARDAVTRLYVDAGYLSSGALLPDQDVNEGAIELEVVEGRLGEVSVRGTTWLRRSWVEQRARRGAREPLRVQELEQALVLLQQDPRIRRVDALLAPGPARDLSVLDLRVEEEQPWRLDFRGANDLSTSIGGARAQVNAANIDLTGNADTLFASYAQGEGLSEWSASYDIPITPWDTRLAFSYEDSRSEVVEEPFSDLDVKSDRTSFAATLSQPLYETPSARLEVGLTGERQRSRLRILGEDFGFSPGVQDGIAKETVLRPHVAWTARSRDQVVALRFSGNFGIDAFDATIAPSSDTPDGEFTYWLLQAQLARRLPESLGSSQLIARLDLQLAQDPLLPLDQLTFGGAGTVRGYHVNELVRDSGAIASLELRVPIFRDADGSDRLQLAPFFDWAKGWNDQDTEGYRWLASAGVGLRYALGERMHFAVYWGGRLRHVDDKRGGGLQNAGISAELAMVAF